MPTVPYRTAIKEMVEANPKLAEEMLEDALAALRAGDVEDGRLLLRQYLRAIHPQE